MENLEDSLCISYSYVDRFNIKEYLKPGNRGLLSEYRQILGKEEVSRQEEMEMLKVIHRVISAFALSIVDKDNPPYGNTDLGISACRQDRYIDR